MLHCIKQVPTRTLRQRFDVSRHLFGMAVRKNEELRLQTNYFFKADMGPVLRGLDNGAGSSVSEGVANKCVLTDGNQWLGPDDEERAGRLDALQLLLQAFCFLQQRRIQRFAC